MPLTEVSELTHKFAFKQAQNKNIWLPVFVLGLSPYNPYVALMR